MGTDVTIVSPTVTDDGNLAVGFARLEGKVDVVLTRHDVRIENLETNDRDKEHRLRVLEARRTVSPRDLLVTGGSVVALAVGITTLINWLRPVLTS